MINLKYFVYISLIFLFLPAFVFPLAGRTYRVCFIVLLGLFSSILLFYTPLFLNMLNKLYKNTTFKFLLFFLAFLLIESFILVIQPDYSFPLEFLYLLQLIFLYILPCFLLSAFFIPRFINLNKFIKFYYIAMLSIFVFGLIEYVGGKILGINIINSIQEFIANERLFVPGYIPTKRLCSIFAEPGWLGGFIFLNFPMLYELNLSKYKLFKKKLLNISIKKSLVILAWINIIFTFSPIWLILCIIQALYFYYKQISLYIIKNCKKIFLMILILFSLTNICFKTNIKNTAVQFKRINAVIANIDSYEKFAFVEPSLASRITSYFNLLDLFKHNIILGTGLNHIQYKIIKSFYNTNIVLTEENSRHLTNSYSTRKMHFNTSIFYALAAGTGIIGITLYYFFVFKTIRRLKFLQTYFFNDKYYFILGYEKTLYTLLIMTFYDTFLSNPFIWFWLGIGISIQNLTTTRENNS